MRIAIANAKGGVAKTTTAIYLASTIAHRGGLVEVWDADPQSSASLWADAAADAGDPLPYQVLPANLSTMRRLASASVDDGRWSIIDCPPQGKLLEAAVRSVDFVIVPTSDSPMDLQQAWATLDEVLKNTPASVLVVRAQCNTRAFRDTMDALEESDSPRFETVIRFRQEIKKGLGSNPGDKLYEYRDLLTEIDKELR
ncbi:MULTISPECIES: ParA family protein [Bifidobacterium]|uniref:Chromosome partitioning protein parA n=2 Tax=Bifidobacterium TaxID=1678 RepID=A0A261FTH4_9BIFI|nr:MULTISPECIES: ParA family protein [Bifidobacterium]OZG62494.1 chromosome partitioning protein parA [Bifidobacterium lemurum]OZG69030.1 chromosome partitioning protein parA [Bifidobacterium eulemuris]QOL31442.1 ParA family protein [Bifidobacterium eulemuris]QOL33835.1 ParA family protein [Bifidobacterium lemurum]